MGIHNEERGPIAVGANETAMRRSIEREPFLDELDEPREAGEGEHHFYRIVVQGSSDTGKLTPRNHYLGVDAVAWFVNQESSLFSKRMVSGTLDIQVASGQEKYQTGLGTFELKEGAKTAPIFERPVLPDRNYRGGVLTFNVNLASLSRDTMLGGLIKSATAASLDVVAGMVETASVAGPAKILTAAAGNLVGGLRKALSDSSDGQEPVFDAIGIEATIRPDDVVGPEIYLLFHRGSKLHAEKISIGVEGAIKVVHYNGKLLDDGAWVLLRVRRSDEYSGVREWFDTERAIRSEVARIVDMFAQEVLDKAQCLAQLKRGAEGTKTVWDKYEALSVIIDADGVLSEREAGLRKSFLAAHFTAARNAIRSDSPAQYQSELKKLLDSIGAGRTPQPLLRAEIDAAISTLVAERSLTSVREGANARMASMNGGDLYNSMQYLNKTLAEFRSSIA